MSDLTRPYLRLSPELLSQVDAYWHQRQLRTRHDALVELLQLGLGAHLDKPSEFTSGKAP